ncbi:MAG: hypothetical protein WC452_05795 [Aminobacteriaceae bacterium]
MVPSVSVKGSLGRIFMTPGSAGSKARARARVTTVTIFTQSYLHRCDGKHEPNDHSGKDQ